MFMIVILCLCFYLVWLCVLMTNPLRYLRFGMIVCIVSTYRTNAYFLHVVHLGSWEYWFSWRVEFPRLSRREKVVSPHSIEDEPLIPLCLSLYFRLYVGCVLRFSFMPKIDSLWDNVITDASAFMIYLLVYV